MLKYLTMSFVTKISTVIFLIIIFNTTIIEQDAFGHGVPDLEEQESFIIIPQEDVNRQSLKNGQTSIFTGTFTANDDININEPLSVYLETAKLCNELNILSINPEGIIGHVNKGDTIPYEIKLTLDSGVFHVHTLVNVESFGQTLGKGITIVVEDSPNSPKTSEWCDERNSFWIITYTILLSVVIIIIMGVLIFKRKKLS